MKIMGTPGRTSVAAILTLAIGPWAHAQETPTFPASREVVRVDVAVTDDRGAPIEGLTAGDFTVTSDGKPVEIATFEAIVVQAPQRTEPAALTPVSDPIAAPPDRTRAFLFFFDDVHLSPAGAEQARRALEPVLAQQVRPGDWVTVMSASGRKWTGRTAAELELLPRVLPTLSASRQVHTMAGNITSARVMTDYEAMMVARFGRYHGGAAAPSSEERDAQTLPSDRVAGKMMGGGRHLEAQKAAEESEQMAEALRRYAEAQHRVSRSLAVLKEAIASFAAFRGRKSAFVYSEGFIKSPDLGDYEAVAALARRTRTALYTIDPRRLTTGAQTLEYGLGSDARTSIATQQDETGGSDYVALATGGRASRATDPTTLFREVAQEASAYYLIGFDPPPGPAGERTLKIETRRPGARVHALDRYVTGEGAAPPAADTVEDALRSVFDAIDVRLRVGTSASPEKPGATVVAVLFPRQAADGERTLDFRIEARPLGKGEPVRDGGEITLPPADRPALAKRTLSLAPGIWQARVVARDRKTGAVGSVLHTFEVVAPAAGG
jgi:VWFA-related protein